MDDQIKFEYVDVVFDSSHFNTQGAESDDFGIGMIGT